MAYQKQTNPYLSPEGYPLPGMSAKARAFAEAENKRYLDSLAPADRDRIEARQQNAQAHQNS